jgi:hypothetical protein
MAKKPTIEKVMFGKRIGFWYIYDKVSHPTRYLHVGGAWRNSTFHEGSYSGHFRTRDEAREAVRKYCSKE